MASGVYFYTLSAGDFTADTSVLAAALAQAVVDQDIIPELLVREIVGHITSEIQSYTFLKSVSIIPKGSPIAAIAIPANLIAKMGNVEIRMRKLLYAFWIASAHADTAIALQEVANREAAKLWDAINTVCLPPFHLRRGINGWRLGSPI